MHMHDSVCQYQTGCVLVAEETAEGPGFLQLIPLSDPPAVEGSSALSCPALTGRQMFPWRPSVRPGWFLSTHLYWCTHNNPGRGAETQLKHIHKSNSFLSDLVWQPAENNKHTLTYNISKFPGNWPYWVRMILLFLKIWPLRCRLISRGEWGQNHLWSQIYFTSTSLSKLQV